MKKSEAAIKVAALVGAVGVGVWAFKKFVHEPKAPTSGPTLNPALLHTRPGLFRRPSAASTASAQQQQIAALQRQNQALLNRLRASHGDDEKRQLQDQIDQLQQQLQEDQDQAQQQVDEGYGEESVDDESLSQLTSLIGQLAVSPEDTAEDVLSEHASSAIEFVDDSEL